MPYAFHNERVALRYGATPDLHVTPGEARPPRIDGGLPRLVPTEHSAGLPVRYFVQRSLSRHGVQFARTLAKRSRAAYFGVVSA